MMTAKLLGFFSGFPTHHFTDSIALEKPGGGNPFSEPQERKFVFLLPFSADLLSLPIRNLPHMRNAICLTFL